MAPKVCQPSSDVHVWTPLRPGWEPDVATPCDCDGTTWGAYQRTQMQRAAVPAVPAPPQRDRWDVARGAMKCQCCGGQIGGGEQYRKMSGANLRYCIGCAKTAMGEDPPDDLPMTRIADQLRVPESITKHDPAPRLPGSRRDRNFTSTNDLTRRVLDDVVAAARDPRMLRAEGRGQE